MTAAERRHRPDRRRVARGGRRITDLATHDGAHITPSALGEYLAVDRKTVMKWIKAGILPAHRFPTVTAGGIAPNGEWRIKTTDAVAFIESNRYRVS